MVVCEISVSIFGKELIEDFVNFIFRNRCIFLDGEEIGEESIDIVGEFGDFFSSFFGDFAALFFV